MCGHALLRTLVGRAIVKTDIQYQLLTGLYVMAPVTVELEILKKQVWDHNSVGYELLFLILISSTTGIASTL